jgi:hypothetical protein
LNLGYLKGYRIQIQYEVGKKPCRLKNISKLFIGEAKGNGSYMHVSWMFCEGEKKIY